MEDTIQKIHKIFDRLSDEKLLKGLDGDALSYIAVKLAALKGYLIEEKALAHEFMLDQEIRKDEAKAVAYAKAKKEHGSTAAGDIKYSDPDFIKAQEEYGEAKAAFERLKMISADSHDLIDAIKSRVIDLQSARRDERVS